VEVDQATGQDQYLIRCTMSISIIPKTIRNPRKDRERETELEIEMSVKYACTLPPSHIA
jgi:hypothetical protein